MSPEKNREVTLNNNDNVIIFSLDKFIEFFGEMMSQPSTYVHRTKEEEKQPAH